MKCIGLLTFFLQQRYIQWSSNLKICLRKTTNASVNSTYAHAVPPTPGYCGAFAFPVSPGGAAFANFALPGGRYKKNSPGIEST